ncbi:MAG: hypothetical protein M3321_06995 [Actinomycetota bacterium]|nr:hypothetical protein [Actinomycetota bacterium]
MSRRFIAIAVAVAACVAPAVAHAQEGELQITSAELISDTVASETVVVKGTGQCAAPGLVSLRVVVRDLETGGRGLGSATTECVEPGERILWSVQVVARDTRPGDRVLVTASAAGAITAADRKELVLQWQP